MANDWYTLDELALQLGRDRREIEKLVQRGRIPGHRVAGEWRFHTIEITHWLEKEFRQFSGEQVESSYADSTVGKPVTIGSLLKPELVAVPLEARNRRSVLETLIEMAGRSFADNSRTSSSSSPAAMRKPTSQSSQSSLGSDD